VACNAGLFRPDRFSPRHRLSAVDVSAARVPFGPKTVMPQTDEAVFYQPIFQTDPALRKAEPWSSGPRGNSPPQACVCRRTGGEEAPQRSGSSGKGKESREPWCPPGRWACWVGGHHFAIATAGVFAAVAH